MHKQTAKSTWIIPSGGIMVLQSGTDCVYSRSKMEVEFADPDLDRLEVDPRFTGGFAQAIVKSFRKKMQFIRGAHDERDFFAVRGLNFERLAGARAHQHSMRLNDQWRLIVEIKGEGQNRKVLVVSIEDYH